MAFGILADAERNRVVAIAQCKEGKFLAVQHILDHDARARSANFRDSMAGLAIRGVGAFEIAAYDDALAEREAIGLYNDFAVATFRILARPLAGS